MAHRDVGTSERRMRIDGGLVAATIIIGVFLWAVIYLIHKAGLT